MPPKTNRLSKADKQAIAIMIANAFTQICQDNPMQGAVSPGTMSGTVTTVPDTLKAEEVGLFNPDMDDPAELNAGIVTVRCHTVYKDVFTFTDCLTDLAKVRSEEKLWEIFPTLLQGSALIWHSTELSDMERDYLRTCPFKALMFQLTKRFKKQASVALQAIATS